MSKSAMTAANLQAKSWPQDRDDLEAVWTFLPQHLSVCRQSHYYICLRVPQCNPFVGCDGDLQNRVAGHAPKGLEEEL